MKKICLMEKVSPVESNKNLIKEFVISSKGVRTLHTH